MIYEMYVSNKWIELNFNQDLTQKILMLSNATNQPKSTVELGYMCPRGLTGPLAVTLTKQLKYNKRLLLRCIHHFISDLIYNMDHMRILHTTIFININVIAITYHLLKK